MLLKTRSQEKFQVGVFRFETSNVFYDNSFILVPYVMSYLNAVYRYSQEFNIFIE
jgi:hypothetical protein